MRDGNRPNRSIVASVIGMLIALAGQQQRARAAPPRPAPAPPPRSNVNPDPPKGAKPPPPPNPPPPAPLREVLLLRGESRERYDAAAARRARRAERDRRRASAEEAGKQRGGVGIDAVLSLAALALVVAAGFAADAYSCGRRWAGSSYASEWTWEVRCRVSVDGRWIPEDQLRVQAPGIEPTEGSGP